MTRCLIVGAHCDDEILGQGFATFDRGLERKVLILSSDKTNPLRQSYRRGEEALAEVCADLGVSEFRVLSDFHSEFYRLRTRGPGDGPILMDWWNSASAAVREMAKDCDFVAIDNPWGYYSHMDHLLARRMVLSTVDLPVRWCDATYRTTTWPMGAKHHLVPRCEFVSDYSINETEFERMRQHYVTRQAWTWDHEAPLTGSVFEE